MISEALGDYRDAVAQAAILKSQPVYSGSDLAARMMLAADLPRDHDFSGPRASRADMVATLAALQTSTFSTDYPPLPEYERAAAMGDWHAAQDSLVPLLTLPIVRPGQPMRWALEVWIWPKLALADAMLGDFRTAKLLIEKTPRDCYLCMRVRGRIAAQEQNWREADADFAAAAKIGPSMPFADLEWGEMLMAKGDLDGAIAKFTLANQKGPHFADPLEMWGEALIAKNRSDLALAKFEEANKYAPNWGRLHLKWGEALWWSGKHDEAKQQFAAASHLNLSIADRATLNNWAKGHG
jgi:predicted Zn-dependent protease